MSLWVEHEGRPRASLRILITVGLSHPFGAVHTTPPPFASLASPLQHPPVSQRPWEASHQQPSAGRRGWHQWQGMTSDCDIFPATFGVRTWPIFPSLSSPESRRETVILPGCPTPYTWKSIVTGYPSYHTTISCSVSWKELWGRFNVLQVQTVRERKGP